MHTCCDRTARCINVEVYGSFRVVCFEEEELCDYGGRDCFVHCAVEANDPFLDKRLVLAS